MGGSGGYFRNDWGDGPGPQDGVCQREDARGAVNPGQLDRLARAHIAPRHRWVGLVYCYVVPGGEDACVGGSG